MAGETKIPGKNLLLYVYDGSAYRPCACLTSNPLTSNREVITGTPTKCDPDTESKSYGAFSYSLSLDGEYIDTTSVGGDTAKASHDYLFNLQRAGTKVAWKLDTGLTDTVAYYGTALISDLGLDPVLNENSTFSATFEGEGAIVTVDPNA